VSGGGTGRFTKPVGDFSETNGQLYNLKDDPSERINLWDDCADTVVRLKQDFAVFFS
jgi:hypothetical protein